MPDEEKLTKEELRLKLRQKLEFQKLLRTPQDIRENEMEEIEEKLENRHLPAKERKRLKNRLKLLEEIEEKILNSKNDDYAQYTDNASYGGSLEMAD